MLQSELHKAELTLRAVCLIPEEFDKSEMVAKMLQACDAMKEARELYESDVDPFSVARSVKLNDVDANLNRALENLNTMKDRLIASINEL